jgi:hypothetical protein
VGLASVLAAALSGEGDEPGRTAVAAGVEGGPHGR